MVEQQPDVIELTRRLGREPNIDTALHILQWELGDLTKFHTYRKWHTDPDLRKAWREECMHALGSVLFQTAVIAKLLGYDFNDLITFGVDTVRDRIAEKGKKEGRFQSYVGES